MGIDLQFLSKITRNKKSRYESWDNDVKLKTEFNSITSKWKNWVENNEQYKKSNIASIIISIYRYISAEENNKKRFQKKKTKPLNYEYREIVYVDLGANNYGVEASYEHPAVVIHNGYYFLLVIPGSTGRFGKSDYIINADEKDNFAHKTGLQVDQIRVIDKSRVIKRTKKKVSEDLMNEINTRIFSKYLYSIDKEFKKIREENEILKSENEMLKATIKKVNGEKIEKNS